MGVLAYHTKALVHVTRILWVQMVARAFKSILKESLRRIAYESEPIILHCTSSKLSLLLGNDKDTESFWEKVLAPRIKSRFVFHKKDNSWTPQSLRSNILKENPMTSTSKPTFWRILVITVVELTGIKLKEEALADMTYQPGDILEVCSL